MRHFLICSGIHGDLNGIARLERIAAARRPDCILFAGGILDPCRQGAARSTSWDLTAEDVLFIDQFLAALGRLKVFSAIIPGPAGEPMDEFYRLAMPAELTFPNVHVVHTTLVEAGDLAIYGIGGAVAEGPLIGVETYTRPKVEYLLRTLRRSDRPRKVLLLAAPSACLGRAEGKQTGMGLDRQFPSRSMCGVSGQRPAGAPAGWKDSGGNPGLPCGRSGGLAGLEPSRC